MLTGVPVLASWRTEWVFSNDTNRTVFSIGSTDDSHALVIHQFVFITHAIFLLLSVGAVMVLTIVLVVKLKETSAWRVNAHIQHKDYLAKRERTTVSMVVLIAGILIVCYTPAVTLCIVTYCEAEFSIHGSYSDLYWILWSFVFVFESANSSANIFVYLKMSTRYRHTLKALFINCKGLNASPNKPNSGKSRAVATKGGF